MNLRGIANALTSRISPNTEIVWLKNAGQMQDEIGNTQPLFEPIKIVANIQPVTSDDLDHLENMNQQGTLKAIYLNAQAHGLQRRAIKSADRFKFFNAEWQVMQVYEAWEQDGWSKVLVRKQEIKGQDYEPPQRARPPRRIAES